MSSTESIPVMLERHGKILEDLRNKIGVAEINVEFGYPVDIDQLFAAKRRYKDLLDRHQRNVAFMLARAVA